MRHTTVTNVMGVALRNGAQPNLPLIRLNGRNSKSEKLMLSFDVNNLSESCS